MAPAICFSRKIGIGALEISELVAEQIGYRVVDREMLEFISSESKVKKETVSFYAERYPGEMEELASLLFREKSFMQSDYTKHLFKAVLSIARLEPTIFV